MLKGIYPLLQKVHRSGVMATINFTGLGCLVRYTSMEPYRLHIVQIPKFVSPGHDTIISKPVLQLQQSETGLSSGRNRGRSPAACPWSMFLPFELLLLLLGVVYEAVRG